MTMSYAVAESVISDRRSWIVPASLMTVALVFAGELASLSASAGWTGDDLYSLWAADRTVPFNLALSERILPDSNPPLYYSLLYLFRQFISNDRLAVIALNIGAILAAASAVYIPSQRIGLSGLAVAGIAAFALSGPVLFFASEGRAYVSALSIIFVPSWYAALAIIGFPDQLSFKRAAALGCLAALTHVYAALFCGCLAASLLALAVFFGRKDLFKPGLALGLSASIVFAAWLTIGIHAVDRISWLSFSPSFVLGAASFVTSLALGAPILSLMAAVMALALLALAAFGILSPISRPLFTAFLIAFFLFVLLPVIASFVQPIIFGRYWVIGAPALPVLFLFAAKLWVLDAPASRASNTVPAGAAALYLLAASIILGSSNARANTEAKPFWSGAAIARPLLGNCQGATVHVYFGKAKNVEWPAGIWSFQNLTGAWSTQFKDAQLETTSNLTAASSSCGVLGWAEHAWGWQRLSERDLLKLMKIQASPNDVEIARHASGFVILKRPA
jgi:hypothetical protein